MEQAFAYAAIVMALAAVAGGLYLAGSPAKERMRQLDQRRVNDLVTLASAVDTYYESHGGTLPATTVDIRANFNVAADPVTGAAYEYRVLAGSTYELCATFDLESGPLDEYGNPKPVGMTPPVYPDRTGMTKVPRSWEHPAGYHCFTLDALDGIFWTACSITNPCATGQSCVTLPDRNGAVCVPAGRECEAAKCTAECTIAESYPAQVRCPVPGTVPNPDEPVSSTDCRLMRHRTSGKVDCFGCAGGVCKDPAPNWESYQRDADAMGIPYACYADAGGCQLAQ